MAELVTIELNGLPQEVLGSTTLLEVVRSFEDEHPELIAELDGQYVHPRDYASTRISPGCRLELYLAAFGG